MRSIYNIYEASLLDIEGTIEYGDAEAEKLTTFGKRFTMTNVQNLTDTTAGALFKLGALKKLTANMDYMTDNIESGQFDKKNLCKMFCNLLDHLTYEEIGMGTTSVNKSLIVRDLFRSVFSVNLERWLKKNKIIGSEVRVYCPSTFVCDPGEFRIIIENTKYVNRLIQLIYKIN